MLCGILILLLIFMFFVVKYQVSCYSINSYLHIVSGGLAQCEPMGYIQCRFAQPVALQGTSHFAYTLSLLVRLCASRSDRASRIKKEFIVIDRLWMCKNLLGYNVNDGFILTIRLDIHAINLQFSRVISEEFVWMNQDTYIFHSLYQRGNTAFQ